ncbi:MAG: dihydrodipicolinate synthase family protein [Lentisphaerae bacterium GWF2_45_14]|nr:MAG: dihydrodipicolinate synthase family protein [Lentisphaerae bacterium GWF2_45_14]
MKIGNIDKEILSNVRKGCVIPAMPLALDGNRIFDPICQRSLARYYIDAGAGGIAVGVHSTQFEIRDPEIGLFETVLSKVSDFIDEWSEKREKKIFKVSGICGKTPQALKETAFVLSKGYHAALLSLSALSNSSEDEMIEHVKAVANEIPVIGFYLQPSVGGCALPYSFWRRFAEIENVIAIKMAPFNRYQTFDVVRAVCDAGKESDITLYTGNDDNILIDLLTEYKVATEKGTKKIRIKGGLLGHWCVWTQKAVSLLSEVHSVISEGRAIPSEMLTRAAEITDSNAAFFDPAHAFAGCIPGIHEILRRQGLIKGTWCLNPKEVLSPGQSEEIDRVYRSYPHLHDDDFVKSYLNEWGRD